MNEDVVQLQKRVQDLETRLAALTATTHGQMRLLWHFEGEARCLLKEHYKERLEALERGLKDT